MIDHHRECTGMPCNCKTSAWEDNAWVVANPGISKTVDGCNCIHISGVWMTRHSTQCTKHPCVACSMRAGHHVGHIHIEGWGAMPNDVEVRTCWACGKQQYKNRLEQWTHVYPAAGCLHDHDTREQNTEGAR